MRPVLVRLGLTGLVAAVLFLAFEGLRRIHPALVFVASIAALLHAGYRYGQSTTHERQARESLILCLFCDRAERAGRDLLDRGIGHERTVYTDLRRLAAEGLLTCREAPGGPERAGRPRYLYRITEAGIAWHKGVAARAAARRADRAEGPGPGEVRS